MCSIFHRSFVCVSLNSIVCLCTCFEAVVSSSEVCTWFLSGVKCKAENISCLLTDDLCSSVLCLSAEVSLYSVAGVLWSPVLMERRRQIEERNPANKASRVPFPCLQTVCDPIHLLLCCHDFFCLKNGWIGQIHAFSHPYLMMGNVIPCMYLKVRQQKIANLIVMVREGGKFLNMMYMKSSHLWFLWAESLVLLNI